MILLLFFQQNWSLGSNSHNLTTSFRDYFQYQREATPVPFPANVEQQVLPNNWWTPFSLPPVFFKPASLRWSLARVLPIAAYETANNLTAEAVTSDRFVKSMEEPPARFRQIQLRRREYLYPTEATSHWYTPTAPELGGHIGWFSPFSQHTRLHEIISRRQRSYTYAFEMAPPGETTSPPAPMPDAILTTQLVTYPLPHWQPEHMVAS